MANQKEKINRVDLLTLTGQQPTPTGKVVGRENLSPQAQKAIARLDFKKDCGFLTLKKNI